MEYTQIQKGYENSGQPFWASLGFVDSGKVDPDNHLPIYIKRIGQ
ncbi:MAG: hypothetical protein ACM3WU_05395 [Bacillota bacterium]